MTLSAHAGWLALGWRCLACNAHTFDVTKPCAICALKKRENAA